ncbi:MAG: NUDIX domain-containing protein [bacterium]|nr:NUDIX domain-containing protein [bacterium]
MQANNSPSKEGEDQKRQEKVVSAGIIVFRKTREGTKFLILYHGRGYWNFPKGKLEQQERSWQAALREVQEETGLKAKELKLLGNFKAFEKFHYNRGGNKIFKVVILYLAETHQPRITIGKEHQGYGWFRFSQAKKILSKHKDSVKILEKASAYLNRQRRKPSNQQQKSSSSENK